jgi:hypothetical protein
MTSAACVQIRIYAVLIRAYVVCFAVIHVLAMRIRHMWAQPYRPGSRPLILEDC